MADLVDNGAAVGRGTAVGVLRATALWLVAEARRHGDTVPSLGPTAGQHSGASLGLHARAKAMHLGAVAAVGLEGTLGHRTVLIRESLPCGQVLSIADSVQIGQSPAIPARHPSAAHLFRPSLLHMHAQRISRPRNAAHCHRRRESSSSLTPLVRVLRISVVNSPQKLSVLQVALHVFTSSGATYFFDDNAAHSMLLSVLVSAPFTTEFSGVTPQPWIEQASAYRFPVAWRDSGRGAKERTEFHCVSCCSRRAAASFLSSIVHMGHSAS